MYPCTGYSLVYGAQKYALNLRAEPSWNLMVLCSTINREWLSDQSPAVRFAGWLWSEVWGRDYASKGGGVLGI